MPRLAVMLYSSFFFFCGNAVAAETPASWASHSFPRIEFPRDTSIVTFHAFYNDSADLPILRNFLRQWVLVVSDDPLKSLQPKKELFRGNLVFAINVVRKPTKDVVTMKVPGDVLARVLSYTITDDTSAIDIYWPGNGEEPVAMYPEAPIRNKGVRRFNN